MDAGQASDSSQGGGGGARRTGTSGLGVGIWSWRPAESNLSWSDGVHALLQVPTNQPASWELWLKQVHPDDQDMVRRTLLPPACNREHARTLDYRLIRGDGSTIRIEDRRQMDADGACQGVFIDVTQTAGTVGESLQAGSCAQRVMEVAGIGVFFRDFENGQDYWNEALYAICGLDRSTSPPACDQLLPSLHPDDADRVRRQVDLCRSSGSNLELEYRIVTPAGEQRWIREFGCYQTGAGGQLQRYHGALQDVTDEKRRTTELEENRRLLNLALELNDIGVWEHNIATGRQVWSDQFFRIMGYVPGEVTPGQEPWLAVLHPEDRDWAADLFEAESKSGVHAFTYRIIAGGVVRWIRESWKDFTAADGSSIRLGVTADITDWKESEHRYSITDRWLTLAVAGGRIGLWSHDGPAHAYHWNDYMFTLLGYRKGDVEPSEQAWYDRIHPADVERVRSALEVRRADGREVVIEYRVLLPGNVERWLEERGSAKEKGASIHHGVLFDITDQKAFQQQLEASRQKLQLALDAGRMGFWSGHEDKEEWDERTYRILGHEPYAVTPCSETFLRSVHPEDRPDVLAHEDHEDWVRHSGDEVVQEYRIVKPDGSIRWVESRRWHAAGDGLDRYGVVADITERKAREEFHLRSQRLEAAGQLLRGLAHDFNNFLAVISATLEPMGEMAHDPETARRLLVARQAAAAGALFSRRLINISKHREWRPQHLSMGEHVSRLAGIMRPLMKSGITLSMQCPDDLWAVNVDPLECDSAIINLLINARDAIATAGDITITVSNVHLTSEAPGRTGDYVVLTVRDTGRGMDGSTLARATEPFFTTKPEGSGTGLGLSSVSAFAAAAGGYVKIGSAPGIGTTVSLHLPRAGGVAETAAGQDAKVPRGGGELVLVVDDDASVRESTMQRLEALGYAVDEAPDATSALEALQSTAAFDLVLSDINMPGPMNGLALRDRLAAEMPHIPVVLITAHEEMAGGAGQSQILSKFCSQPELAQALASALASSGGLKEIQEGTQETGAAST